MFKQLFLAQDFYHNTLCAMCIKCMNVTRTKFMPYYNVKKFKKSNLLKFWAIHKTWVHIG
jgi:hypothetical protein